MYLCVIICRNHCCKNQKKNANDEKRNLQNLKPSRAYVDCTHIDESSSTREYFQALTIIENFHTNARKVAGSIMPVSVLAAGVSSASASTNNYGTSNFSSNSLDTSYFQNSFATYVKPNNTIQWKT